MLKAEDLWPVVAKMPRHERVRLARMALVKGNLSPEASDAERYSAVPVEEDEFDSADDDMMAWEGDGWEEAR
jgi:hypothetical protein